MGAVDPVPFLMLGAIAAAAIWFGLRQQRSYAGHVAEVKQLNDEVRSLNRLNHDIAKRQLAVLEDIKSLLESRKP